MKYRKWPYSDYAKVNKGKYAAQLSLEIERESEIDENLEVFSESTVVKQPETPDGNETIEPEENRPLEETIQNALNEVDQKCVQSPAMEALQSRLQSSYIPDVVKSHQNEISKIILRGLKSGQAALQKQAARLVPLIAIQQLAERKFLLQFESILIEMLGDKSLEHLLRAEICSAAAILKYFIGEKRKGNDVFSVLMAVEKVFVESDWIAGPYDYTPISTEKAVLHATAVNAWALLVQKVWTGSKYYQDMLPYFTSMLSSSHSNIRIAVIRAMAMIVERGRPNGNKEFYEREVPLAVKTISNIWMRPRCVRTEGRLERKTIDLALSYFSHDSFPEKRVRCGNKWFEWDTWSMDIQYEMLRGVLGALNLPSHLTGNDLLLEKLDKINADEKPLYWWALVAAPHSDVRERIDGNFTFFTNTKKTEDINLADGNLLPLLERALSVSSKTRDEALTELSDEIQQSRFSPEAIGKFSEEISSVVTRTVRREKEANQIIAIRLGIMVSLQLGSEWDTGAVRIAFKSLIRDSKAAQSVISWALTALSFFSIAENDRLSDKLDLMQTFRKVFTEKYKNLTKSEMGPMTKMKRSALEAWALLAVSIPSDDLCALMDDSSESIMNSLLEMLQSPQVELRLTTGEVISMILEHGRAHDSEFLESHIPELKRVAAEAARNQNRTVNKVNRKTEQVKFREISKYLTDGMVPGFQLRFGEEFHQLNGWAECFRYRKLCEIIGPALTTHFQKNTRLRDILPIGPPADPLIFDWYSTPTLEHKLVNAAKRKSRTKMAKQNRLCRMEELLQTY